MLAPLPALFLAMAMVQDSCPPGGARISGTVRVIDVERAAAGATLRAEWTTPSSATPPSTTRVQTLTVRAANDGGFCVGNLPNATDIFLGARWGELRSGSTRVRTGVGNVVRVDVFVGGRTASGPGAVAFGTVWDSAGSPLENVRVTVDESFVATTNEKGRFRMEGLPTGTYDVLVRSLGFSPVRIRVPLSSRSPVAIEVRLRPIARLLETVIVEEEAHVLASRRDFAGFSQRRLSHEGYFYDAAQVRAHGATSFEDLFSAIPGLRVAGRQLMSQRGYDSEGKPCRAAIYLDGGFVGGGLDAIAFLFPQNVIGIEVYHIRPPSIFRPPSTSDCTASVVLWTSSVTMDPPAADAGPESGADRVR